MTDQPEYPEGLLANCGAELRARLERLRALRAAWGALAPSGLGAAGREIAEAGRAVGSQLTDLLGRGGAPESSALVGADDEELSSIDIALDSLETSMREVAAAAPVAQLRATLPPRLGVDRSGVLALLDLMLGRDGAEAESLGDRIGAIDYLITLLSTDGATATSPIVWDPVTLTPKLQGLCERADAIDDPRSSEVESEFFAAAGMDGGGIHTEIELRALRRRKTELGMGFFASRVLRAIATYNAMLLQRVAHEVDDSKDWGEEAAEAFAEIDAEELVEASSVFETEALREIAEALRRRRGGGEQGPGAVDRIAWFLDIKALRQSERAALLSSTVGSGEDPQGTTILVGLLSRSLDVLAAELAALGISAERVASDWVKELDEALKVEVDELIAADAYQDACAITELRTKFLYAEMADLHGSRRSEAVPRPEPADPEDVRETARRLSQEARSKRPKRPGRKPGRAGQPERSTPQRAGRHVSAATRARAVVAVAAVGLLVVQLVRIAGGGADIEGLGRDELARISPHLTEGRRNGGGAGTAFVGVIDERWSSLEPEARERAGIDLIAALRARGVSEVMVFDAEDRVRIQALGERTIRIVPPEVRVASTEVRSAGR